MHCFFPLRICALSCTFRYYKRLFFFFFKLCTLSSTEDVLIGLCSNLCMFICRIDIQANTRRFQSLFRVSFYHLCFNYPFCVSVFPFFFLGGLGGRGFELKTQVLNYHQVKHVAISVFHLSTFFD